MHSTVLVAQSATTKVFEEGLTAMGVLAVLGAVLIVLIKSLQGGRERRRRLEAIETALRNPALTPEVQRELTQMLRPPPKGRTSFGLGWIGVALGIGWLLTDPVGSDFDFAVMLTAASFAVVTLPLALRELEARRA